VAVVSENTPIESVGLQVQPTSKLFI